MSERITRSKSIIREAAEAVQHLEEALSPEQKSTPIIIQIKEEYEDVAQAINSIIIMSSQPKISKTLKESMDSEMETLNTEFDKLSNNYVNALNQAINSSESSPSELMYHTPGDISYKDAVNNKLSSNIYPTRNQRSYVEVVIYPLI